MYSELPYAKYTNLPYPGERDQFKIDSWSPKKKICLPIILWYTSSSGTIWLDLQWQMAFQTNQWSLQIERWTGYVTIADMSFKHVHLDSLYRRIALS